MTVDTDKCYRGPIDFDMAQHGGILGNVSIASTCAHGVG